ncbi:unnamed protein product [Eruca vesicaria subsp. sativa]|uniref:Protein kinase domain-containing protein n=1 Tax=Eruca vesicaria subsp. sativa TaxID=29727 RepID=A0ABC8K2D7_ERUVS|nr:unnamed protein product [Eruca vesicaria subsp. sativa]
MKTNLLSSLITNKKRKIIVSTPRKNYDQFGSSLQIISQRAFEAAVYKLSTPVKSPVRLSLAATTPPPNNDQDGSSLQIIDRSIFEAAGTKKSPKLLKLLIRDEEQILKDLSSPHVITFYGSNITPAETRPLGSDYNLILEYCSGGSISDFLKFRGVGMAESDVQLFSLHILKGINYVQSKKIIHCDIKPANIFLNRKTSDEYGDGCGFARGTLLYMSPELLLNGNLDYSVDIWAYGCTLLQMFTGKKPWSELGHVDMKKLKNVFGNINVLPEIPMWLSDDARDFLGKCLEKYPQESSSQASKQEVQDSCSPVDLTAVLEYLASH